MTWQKYKMRLIVCNTLFITKVSQNTLVEFASLIDVNLMTTVPTFLTLRNTLYFCTVGVKSHYLVYEKYNL